MRLQPGFVAVLHGLVADALLNTSSSRVEISPEWFEQADGFTLVRVWLLSPDDPHDRTALELRSQLSNRLVASLSSSLTLTDDELSLIHISEPTRPY